MLRRALENYCCRRARSIFLFGVIRKLVCELLENRIHLVIVRLKCAGNKLLRPLCKPVYIYRVATECAIPKPLREKSSNIEFDVCSVVCDTEETKKLQAHAILTLVDKYIVSNSLVDGGGG